MRTPVLLILSAAILAACGGDPGAGAPTAASSPAAADAAAVAPTGGPVELKAMLDDWWELQLQRNPILATAVGDLRYNDQLPDMFSAEVREQAMADTREYLARARSIDPAKLDGQDLLSWEIFVRDREESIAGEAFPAWMMPLHQMGNYGSFFAQLGSGQSLQPFRETKHYDDFLARIARFPVLNDSAIASLRAGIEAGVVLPKPVVEKLIPQFAAHVVERAEDSVFWGPVAAFPDAVPAAERERLTAAYREAIAAQLVPAYAKMRDFLRDEYLPAARASVGLSALPDGRAWYAYMVRQQTTTGLTPEEIHRFGLDEVARILGEMNAVREQVGFAGDLPAFFQHLQEDPQFYFGSEEEALQAYRDIQQKINARIPQLFDVFPKADYEVRAVEAFRAESEAGASYMAPAPDGSRPGIFYLNTFNLKAQPKFLVETLSIHEASPGHHFQIAIQQEIEDLPAFRRFGGYTAFAEGWALYAESLGKEMGLFEDPYQWYGRLSDEQLRAMRLVVDTGLHYYGWTREQAIDYMKANSSMAESDIVAEVERYIAMPGQALAYKVGQREIRSLREEAERELGDRFDVKAFHRQVLIDGALPMDVLASKIRAWIATEKSRPD
ncbi:DUF885 domain-containing protein [Arenimonas composti]|uniref:DUF885 domain-containing protein n=1 Tax=Arenimonas composti TR7-09 = DSM 18010 TaxID=1121013 RepID=A0A091BIS6_9GAMM|nr:DUF885 domain-containing protein [Arenimonas composti]KFN50689.1 hypothetical protein P873_05875 [Arenimonas composti TR7-09 = DSM 18010]